MIVFQVVTKKVVMKKSASVNALFKDKVFYAFFSSREIINAV